VTSAAPPAVTAGSGATHGMTCAEDTGPSLICPARSEPGGSGRPATSLILVACTVAIGWRDSAQEFARILDRRGPDQDAVHDVDRAWQAFCEFMQLDVDGIDPEPDSDADGFIVQWGRYSWNDGRISLSFMRQLASVEDVDLYDEVGPVLWQVSLTMLFDDSPQLQGVDGVPTGDTGFSFEPIGPQRVAALAEARVFIQSQEPLQELWQAIPARSTVVLDAAD